MMKNEVSWYELSRGEQDKYYQLVISYQKMSESVTKWENLASEPIGFNGGIITVGLLIIQNIRASREKKKLEKFRSLLLSKYKRNGFDKDFPNQGIIP